MAGDNLTAVLYGIDDLRLEQRPVPTPNGNQVLLQMEVVGICGSDVHYLKQGRIGHFVVKQPMVIGHEASGTVVKVGKDVTHLKVGDRVAIEPGECCRMCNYCKEGRYNLCLKMAFCATPPYDGNLTRFYAHAADFCYKLPNHVSFEEGAILEPLSVGVHACKRGQVTCGSKVLILGAGPIGLVTLLAAKAFGATNVIITDIVENRLEIAKKLGAHHTLLVDKNFDEKTIIEKVVQILGCEPDVSMECSGAEQSVRIAIQATKSGGCAVLIGMGKAEMTLPLASALIREVDIKGVFRYVNDYETALAMVSSGKIDVKPLITHEFAMEQTLDAFGAAMDPKSKSIKVLIHANPEWKKLE